MTHTACNADTAPRSGAGRYPDRKGRSKILSARLCVSPAGADPWKKAIRRRCEPQEFRVPSFQVLMRHVWTSSAGSAYPSSRHKAAMDLQSMVFPTHSDIGATATAELANSKTGSSPPGASRHSRKGHLQTQ